MKNLILIMLCCIPFLSISQKLTQQAEKVVDKMTYYVLPIESDTIFGTNFTLTGFKVRLDVNDQKLKWDKKDLKDYGHIKNGKKRASTYHLTAFQYATDRGSIIKGINSDTVDCFIKQWTVIKPKSLIVYFPNHQ